MNRKLLPLLLVVLLTGSSAAISVGVAPGYIHVGTIQRGETAKVNIYLTSNSNSPFRVNPGFKQPFSSTKFGGLGPVEPGKVSEQSIGSWIEFSKQSFTVNPNDTDTVALSDGTIVASNGKITMYVKVPETGAEPGYHVGRVSVSPVAGSGRGYGAAVIAQSSVEFSFRVPGEAERELRLTDVNAFRLKEDVVRIDTKIKNTGTVTTQANSTKFLIENFVGENVESIRGGSALLSPGESEWLSSYWNGKEVSAGQYTLKSNIGYITGQSFASRAFSVTDAIRVKPVNQTGGNQTGTPSPSGETLPTWLVVMFLILVGVLMYSFKIDPMWILVFLGLLSAALFIFLSGASNYLLLVLLTAGGLIIYYGGI
ncbi:MAG: hypothetical protein ABEJ36_01440 [Candidatus Nanosalina sp.]